MPRKRIFLVAERQSVTRKTPQARLLQGRDETVPGREVRNCRAMQGKWSAQQRRRLFAGADREIAEPDCLQLKGNNMRGRPCRLACRLAIGSADGEFGKVLGDQTGHIARHRGCKGRPQECQVGRRACRGIVHGKSAPRLLAGGPPRCPPKLRAERKDRKRPIKAKTSSRSRRLSLICINRGAPTFGRRHDLMQINVEPRSWRLDACGSTSMEEVSWPTPPAKFL